MPRSIQAPMRTMLDGNRHTLADMFRVEFKTNTFAYFTAHHKSILFDDGDGEQLYLSTTGVVGSAMESNVELNVDTSEFVGVLQGPAVTRDDILAGRWDGATIRRFKVNWEDPSTSMGDIKFFEATIGAIKVEGPIFVAELRSKTQLLSQKIVWLITPDCRVDVGSDECAVVLAPNEWAPFTTYVARPGLNEASNPGITKALTVVKAIEGTDGFPVNARRFECTTPGTSATGEPAWDLTVGNTTLDNDIVWTTQYALSMKMQVTNVSDRRTFEAGEIFDFPADWWQLGIITWLTGLNAGLSMDVKGHGGTADEFVLFKPMGYDIQVGDEFTITAGCDKFRSTTNGCKTKFRNIVNFRGFPDVPGNDQLFFVPTSPSA